MTQKVSDRIAWAVETLAVEPDDHLLEIGCGHGVAVSLVCEKLVSGKITAIDRSKTMIQMASRRNQSHIDAGKATFQHAALREADFSNERFNKIFAIHVNLVREQPSRELAIISELLLPEGALYLCNQPPLTNQVEELANRTVKALEDHNFAIQNLLFAELRSGRAFCVIAKLAS